MDLSKTNHTNLKTKFVMYNAILKIKYNKVNFLKSFWVMKTSFSKKEGSDSINPFSILESAQQRVLTKVHWYNDITNIM